MADEEAPKPPSKPRSSAPLAAGVALLLSVPLVAFGLKVLGPLLFAPDEGPRPAVVISDPKKLERPAPKDEPVSSLNMIQQQPAEEAPAQSPPPAPAATAAVEPVQPLPQREEPLEAPKKSYPKLRPNRGWKSWVQRNTVPQAQTAAVVEDAQPPKIATPPRADIAPAAEAPKPPPAPAPPPAAPVKAKKKGFKPPAPVYTQADQATSVGSGGPAGELATAAGELRPAQTPQKIWTEHTVSKGPADTLPEPNPEKPKSPDAPCPKRGWWKSTYDGLCYYSKANCVKADYEHKGCFQPNP